MSIPLVQKAEKDDINTSIIAIKRNIERINMLLGLSNSEEIDTSEFVKKSEIVDEVALDNMQSVSSGAVYSALNNFIKYKEVRTNALTIGQGGWTDISSYMPTGMNNFLFALMYNFGTVSNGTAITISSNGLYVSGTEYATVNYLEIRYYYTD